MMLEGKEKQMDEKSTTVYTRKVHTSKMNDMIFTGYYSSVDIDINHVNY